MLKEKLSNGKPLISVYMPTHNRADLLARAIDSVLVQTFEDFELIVVDDGSKDNTKEILDKYSQADSRVRYITVNPSRGACAARNKAIKSAIGEYVTGIDDDDMWSSDRLAVLLDSYSAEYSFVFTDDVFLMEDGREKRTDRPEVVDIDDIRFQNDVGNQAFTERRKLVESGLFDEELVSAQDYDMWYRMISDWGKGVKVSRANSCQYLNVGADDRITASKKKKYGYLNFYRKHKVGMSRAQRKHQLLMIKYVCQDRVGLKTFLILFTFDKVKRKAAVFLRKVVCATKYRF